MLQIIFFNNQLRKLIVLNKPRYNNFNILPTKINISYLQSPDYRKNYG